MVYKNLSNTSQSPGPSFATTHMTDQTPPTPSASTQPPLVPPTNTQSPPTPLTTGSTHPSFTPTSQKPTPIPPTSIYSAEFSDLNPKACRRCGLKFPEAEGTLFTNGNDCTQPARWMCGGCSLHYKAKSTTVRRPGTHNFTTKPSFSTLSRMCP
jgi:rubredoxin